MPALDDRRPPALESTTPAPKEVSVILVTVILGLISIWTVFPAPVVLILMPSPNILRTPPASFAVPESVGNEFAPPPPPPPGKSRTQVATPPARSTSSHICFTPPTVASH